MDDREKRIRAAIDAKHKEVGNDHAIQLRGLGEEKKKPGKHAVLPHRMSAKAPFKSGGKLS